MDRRGLLGLPDDAGRERELATVAGSVNGGYAMDVAVPVKV
jgi:hypothetical protein